MDKSNCTKRPHSGDLEGFRRFLAGAPAERPYVCLDPSSFAAVLAGRSGGAPTIQELLAFHRTFPNDAPLIASHDIEALIPSLKWKTEKIREDADGTVFWHETLATPKGTWTRERADRPGTTSWLVKPAIREPHDFALVDYYAEQVENNVDRMADWARSQVPAIADAGLIPGAIVLTAFEVYYLIDYADMPLAYMDWSERYLESVRRVHAANLKAMAALRGAGFEFFGTGSAGLELLSPRIFEEAIVPFQRDFNDSVHRLDGAVSYHICGHSRRLIEDGIIDAIRPTIFETLSPPPCGNIDNLAASATRISPDIITKGNLPLELLRNGTPEQIAEAVAAIRRDTAGRRHIIGQADATILAGTPTRNIEAFLEAAR